MRPAFLPAGKSALEPVGSLTHSAAGRQDRMRVGNDEPQMTSFGIEERVSVSLTASIQFPIAH